MLSAEGELTPDKTILKWIQSRLIRINLNQDYNSTVTYPEGELDIILEER